MAGVLNLEVMSASGVEAVNTVIGLRTARPDVTAFITNGGGLNALETLYADRRGEPPKVHAFDRMARWFKTKALTVAYGGAWPKALTPDEGFLSVRDLKTSETMPVYIAVAAVPQRTWWEIFPYLRFGGWNENPPASDHSKTMARWARQYGVELVGLTYDVVEVSVARPPRTKGSALSLAEQHFHYCEDNLLQGPGSVREYAAGLINANVWSFWWD